MAEYRATRGPSQPKLDFDGYAVQWGDKHRAATIEECAGVWRKPVPPNNFPCNAFVFCPTPKCYAPAALPPGSMTGQCWLKHQDDSQSAGEHARRVFRGYIKRPGSTQSRRGSAGVSKGTKVDHPRGRAAQIGDRGSPLAHTRNVDVV